MHLSDCKLVCVAQYDGPHKDLGEHLHLLTTTLGMSVQLVLFNGSFTTDNARAYLSSYSDFVSRGKHSKLCDTELNKKESLVRAADTVNLQFTSGMEIEEHCVEIVMLILHVQARPAVRKQPCCRTCEI